MEQEKKKNIRRLSGIVVSCGMSKTIVVKVDRQITHKKYLKKYTVSKKYKVHDEHEEYKVGNKATFVACRPMSKEKSWRVLPKVKKV